MLRSTILTRFTRPAIHKNSDKPQSYFTIPFVPFLSENINIIPSKNAGIVPAFRGLNLFNKYIKALKDPSPRNVKKQSARITLFPFTIFTSLTNNYNCYCLNSFLQILINSEARKWLIFTDERYIIRDYYKRWETNAYITKFLLKTSGSYRSSSIEILTQLYYSVLFI